MTCQDLREGNADSAVAQTFTSRVTEVTQEPSTVWTFEPTTTTVATDVQPATWTNVITETVVSYTAGASRNGISPDRLVCSTRLAPLQ